MKLRTSSWVGSAIVVSLAVAVVGCGRTDTPPNSPEAESGWERIEQTGTLEAGARPSQIVASLAVSEQEANWQPQVNSQRTRGPSLAVFPKVAPATVVVRCNGGHGSGFIIDPEGWIVTNHHVIAAAAPDPNTGVPTAMIHFGQMKDGWMKLIDESVPAVLYKSSPQQDLALLKLTRRPAGMETLPTIALAEAVPPPGSDCIVIGHPRAGVLWTVRSGDIVGQAIWPKEQINVMMATLSATPQDRDKLSRIIAAAPHQRVLLSSCGLNPGDSGGPLVDLQGRLIGVSFASPASDDSGINLDKFSYHVHLDEVKAFLADRPAKPLVFVPNPWPAARYHKLVDLDKDGKPDALVFTMWERGPTIGGLVKLQADDTLKSIVAKLLGSDTNNQWQFNFAWQVTPLRRTFYDTDGDGKIDLVLTDSNGDGKAESVIRMVDGKWQAEPANGRKMADAAYFTDKALANRFKALKLDEMK
jgi:S1-C subfamily serine protease